MLYKSKDEGDALNMKIAKVFFVCFLFLTGLTQCGRDITVEKTMKQEIQKESEVTFKLVFTDDIINKEEKKAFLTFDDGPSPNVTLDILDILNKNQIKATFFVIGNRVEAYPYILKELVNHKMSICIHTYDHNYEAIYRTPEAYIRDVKKCEQVLGKYMNKPVSKYIRMPGGSVKEPSKEAMMKRIRKATVDNNYKYVDWNVSTGDSLGKNVPIHIIKKNLVTECKGKKYAVILMHDSAYKDTTIKALPDIIEYLRKEGYTFYSFDELTEEDERILLEEGVINKRMNRK